MTEQITIQDIYALFRESEQQRQKYQRIAEQEMADLRKIVAKTNKQVGGLTSRWGEFVENLVKPAAAKLFIEQGYRCASHCIES
jgi:hypothetical protein